jgi:outer membrane immunogenic protein
MKSIRLALTAALLAGSTLSAIAADLPSTKSAETFLSPTPAYSWTSFYVGVNAGYGWGNQNPLSLLSSAFDTLSYPVNGGLVGGTFGAQIQSGHVVMGVEGDFDWSGVSGSHIITPRILGRPAGFTLGSKSTSDSYLDGRFRVGYAQNNWLFYGTAGAAILNSSFTGSSLSGAACGTAGVLPRCSGSSTRFGLAAGAGVEYAINPQWSVKAEYIWNGFVVGAGTESINMIRAGVNYHFGG